MQHFWFVLSSYRRVNQWHIDFDESSDKNKQESEILKLPFTNGPEDDGEKVENESKVKSVFDRQYVRSKLDQGLNRIWQVCAVLEFNAILLC